MRRRMAWLRVVGVALIVGAIGCAGDRCDQDDQCFSNSCYYGECGSTLVTVIERAIDDATEDDDEFSYDDEYDADDLEPARPAPECRAYGCFSLDQEDCERSGCNLLVTGCGDYSVFDCWALSRDECTPECPARLLCSGTPTICEDLDRVSCLAERACRVP